jgi:hypothetical protein
MSLTDDFCDEFDSKIHEVSPSDAELMRAAIGHDEHKVFFFNVESVIYLMQSTGMLRNSKFNYINNTDAHNATIPLLQALEAADLLPFPGEKEKVKRAYERVAKLDTPENQAQYEQGLRAVEDEVTGVVSKKFIDLIRHGIFAPLAAMAAVPVINAMEAAKAKIQDNHKEKMAAGNGNNPPKTPEQQAAENKEGITKKELTKKELKTITTVLKQANLKEEGKYVIVTLPNPVPAQSGIGPLDSFVKLTLERVSPDQAMKVGTTIVKYGGYFLRVGRLAKLALAAYGVSSSLEGAEWLKNLARAREAADQHNRQVGAKAFERTKSQSKQVRTGTNSATPPNPHWDPDDKDNGWSENKDGKWHHPNAKDIKGVHNRPNVRNSKLKEAMDELYRTKDQRPGGTAGELRREFFSGRDTSGHLQKANERITNLQRIIKEEKLSKLDRDAAARVINDLRNTINLVKGK